MSWRGMGVCLAQVLLSCQPSSPSRSHLDAYPCATASAPVPVASASGPSLSSPPRLSSPPSPEHALAPEHVLGEPQWRTRMLWRRRVPTAGNLMLSTDGQAGVFFAAHGHGSSVEGASFGRLGSDGVGLWSRSSLVAGAANMSVDHGQLLLLPVERRDFPNTPNAYASIRLERYDRDGKLVGKQRLGTLDEEIYGWARGASRIVAWGRSPRGYLLRGFDLSWRQQWTQFLDQPIDTVIAEPNDRFLARQSGAQLRLDGDGRHLDEGADVPCGPYDQMLVDAEGRRTIVGSGCHPGSSGCWVIRRHKQGELWSKRVDDSGDACFAALTANGGVVVAAASGISELAPDGNLVHATPFHHACGMYRGTISSLVVDAESIYVASYCYTGRIGTMMNSPYGRASALEPAEVRRYARNR